LAIRPKAHPTRVLTTILSSEESTAEITLAERNPKSEKGINQVRAKGFSPLRGPFLRLFSFLSALFSSLVIASAAKQSPKPEIEIAPSLRSSQETGALGGTAKLV
jgi:hypothetical protein